MDEVVGDFEWDGIKRQETLASRQLDFADIVRFDLDSIQTEPDARRDYGESRYVSVGYLDGRLCVFCWTFRNERTRIISMRKANARDRKKYEARQDAGEHGRDTSR